MDYRYAQQFLATPASSCLTNQELASIDVNILSLSLPSLLLKPGYEFLVKLEDMHNYFAWVNTLVVNGSELSASKSGKFQLVSAIDGSKCSFTAQQIVELISNLQADLVLLPSGLSDNFTPSHKYFLPYTEYKTGFGAYFSVTEDNFSQVSMKIAELSEVPKYVCADLSLDLHLQLASLPNLHIENIKFAEDAFKGQIYRANNRHSILEDNCEHEFEKLVDECSCYTCSKGYTVAYLHHLFKHTPLLCQRLLILHNVFYASHLPSR